MVSKRLEYGCYNCGRKPKSIPYGSKRNQNWCSKCDRDLSTNVNKKRERQKAKKAIKNET